MRLSIPFLLVAAWLTAFATTSDAVAQAWKAYADEIKREAQDDAPNPAENVAPSDLTASDERDESFLSFSDALGDDGSNMTGSVVERDESTPRGDLKLAPPPPSYRNLKECRSVAALNDVCFVSPNRGWAVGDCGTILKTVDGGKSWTLRDAPTDANLYAVSFFDENYGLAVGGAVMPATRAGQGVVLRTIDGGENWGRVETAAFPILRDARILSLEYAWIAGDSSAMYPSGIFVSEDNGVSWEPISTARHAGWRAVMYDPVERLGAGVDMSGEIQTLEGDALARPETSIGLRRLADVCYDGTTGTAWVVGEQGLVMRSANFGVDWEAAQGVFPGGANDYFDLKAVVADAGFVAVVGAPGSLFFRSDDGGREWRASATGVSTPLRKLFFLDAANGWAVGDLGVVAATKDGGATWTLQRRGAERAAVLVAVGRVGDAPLEALVQLARDEGYLAEIALMGREMEFEQTSDEVGRVERLREALVEVGASGLDQPGLFRLDPAERRDGAERLLARFDAENDGKGRRRFRERLARLLREWRPSVVVAPDPALDDPTETATIDVGNAADVDVQKDAALVDALARDAKRLDDRPRDALLQLLVDELAGAVKDAADPTAFPEHLSVCGLEPWRVSKARTLCRAGAQGDMTIDSRYYCPAVGRTIEEIAAKARAILADGSEVVPATNFETIFTDGTPKNANRTFFDGLDVPYASAARRAPSGEFAPYAAALADRAGKRRQKLGVAETLAKQSVATPRSADLFLGQISDALLGVDSDFALDYLTSSGRLFAAVGEWRAAEGIYAAIPPSLFDQPLARPALEWLMQYYCGSEPARRVALRSGVALDEDAGTRLENAKRLAEALRDVAPDAFMAPGIRFPYASVQLRTGDYQGAMRFYLTRSQLSPGGTGGGGRDDVWATRAAAEYWLRAPQGDVGGPAAAQCPLGVATCALVSSKPYLDGKLEPSFWDAAAKLDLSSPYLEAPSREPSQDEKTRAKWRAENRDFSQSLGTNLYLLSDGEYLYVAAECRKTQPGAPREKKNGAAPRPRDAKLDAKERIELALDVDGDYATAAKFVVDRDGWVADSLWNDPTWNPELFVAQNETDDEWTIEAAVPIAAFASEAPRKGTVWRFAVRRIAPGVGVECWNVENSERGENAFGLLRFE